MNRDDPGQRPHYVEVQAFTMVTDDYGGETPTWHTIATAYAKFLPGSGQERREAAQESASVTAVFNFDWSPTLAAVTPSNRLLCFDTAWDVSSAVVIGGNRAVDIAAVANLDAAVDS